MNLTMREAAAQAGLSYERFRKVWTDLCRREGFPAPVHGHTWDAAACAAWRERRSQPGNVTLLQQPDRAPDAGRRARQQLQMLRAG